LKGGVNLTNEEIEYIAASIHDEIDQKFKDQIVDAIDKHDGDPDPKKVGDLVYSVAATLKDYMYELVVKLAKEQNKKA
jgi:hypothetical protein